MAELRFGPQGVEAAALAALAGRLVVVPTETVYGLATRPDREDSTARLFEVKGRPRDLELPVLAPSREAAEELAVMDDRARRLIERFWPGSLTLVLPRSEAAKGWDLGGDPATIGLRVPDHPLALAVLERTGALAGTSANRSGEPTPGSCEEIAGIFGDEVAVYLCSDEPVGGLPSTVLDLSRAEPKLLRAGALPEEEIHAALSG